jgi:transposase
LPQFYVLAPVEFNSAAPSCDCVAHRFGNAADHPERVRRYPSDMTDAEWAVVRPLLPVPGWLRGRGGQPEAYCHRAILDAIRYLVDNGIKWRAVPADFPPWDRVYAFFRRWRDSALVKEFHDRLRSRIRERDGRDTEPTAGVIDSQSVKADAVVGSDSRGFDGAKLVNGPYLGATCSLLTWGDAWWTVSSTFASAGPDDRGSFLLRRVAGVTRQVGGAPFAVREGECLAQLPVLGFQLLVALGGRLQASQQGGVGGSLPVGNGPCRGDAVAGPEAFDLGSQVRLVVEPGP